MTEIHVKTDGNAQPKDKPRVYFTCHPADFERSFERLCAELFKAADCAVYYAADMADRLPAETRDVDLERMNLFVIPVSFRLLSEPNRAMDEDFPFARERDVPVLPILLEPGLDSLYSRPDRFGTLQYLDPVSVDPTAIPYEDKLKKYLLSALLNDKTAAEVREAFDAQIFLSYRKKDRRLANELMKLIHADVGCRSIAVWFDEFLDPAERFDDEIQTAMADSDLFALLVTPSLLERGEKGEPNYVQGTEYPMARVAGLPLLPAEFGTDVEHGVLSAEFPGLPEPLNVLKDEDRERFLGRLRKLTEPETAPDPKRSYLLGLAYLNGMHVELDRDRGFTLVTAAAEAELPEAMALLSDVYLEGRGVPADVPKAAEWARRQAEVLRRTLGEAHPDTLRAYHALAYIYGQLGEHESALAIQEKVYALLCAQDEEAPNTLRAMNNLSVTLGQLGRRREAVELQEKACAAWLRLRGEADPDTLSSLDNLAVSLWMLGKRRRARELLERSLSVEKGALGEKHPQTLRTLHILASLYDGVGEAEKALEIQERICALYGELYGETNPRTLEAMYDMAQTLGGLGRLNEAIRLLETIYARRRDSLGEAHPDTLQTLQDLENARSGRDDFEALFAECGEEEDPDEAWERVFKRIREVTSVTDEDEPDADDPDGVEE